MFVRKDAEFCEEVYSVVSYLFRNLVLCPIPAKKHIMLRSGP